MATRQLGRGIVLQALYEWDFYGRKGNIRSILERDLEVLLSRGYLKRTEFAPGFNDPDFVFKLIQGVTEKIKELDEIITVSAPEWPIEKLPLVDRNVLRIGLYELLHADRDEVPPRVAINEAVELAKNYGGVNSGKFINGVLGTVYREIGEPDKKTSKEQRAKGKEPREPEQQTT